MRSRQRSLLPLFTGLLTLLCCGWPPTAHAQQEPPAVSIAATAPVNTGPMVLTQHNDNARTGANLRETILTADNVRATGDSSTGFGKLYTRQVDGQIYAQPLYVSNLMVNGAKHNVVFVATMHDSVYAFDADDPSPAGLLWKSALVDGVKTFACPIGEVTWSGDVQPEIGIIGTPVIDAANGFLLCVTKTKEITPTGVRYFARLRKLDIHTGKEMQPGVEIKGTVAGKGDGANADGTLTFDPVRHMSRPGLLLQNNIVYIAFGSHGDQIPYHGWVFAFQTKHLTPMAVWCSTPNGKTDPSGYPLGAGGIWQGGAGLVGDDQFNVYLETGNGTFDVNTNGGIDFGDSFVKLHLFSNGRGYSLLPVDYFTPFNQDGMNRADADLGSSGPMLIPGTDFLIGGEKSGRFFVLNRNNMGGFNPAGDTQVHQWFYAYLVELHGSPIYWNDTTGRYIYNWGPWDTLKKFQFDPGRQTFNTQAVAISAMTVDWPGCTLSLSANGNKAGTGIVWAVYPKGNPDGGPVNGVLRAFDARNLAELWNSDMAAGRDAVGVYTKFSAPTVAGGKAFVPTMSGELAVYGLGKWVKTPHISPASGKYSAPVNVTITDDTPGAKIYYTLDGTDPTESSALYKAPFIVTPSVIVRARAFAAGFGPSAIATAQYLVADAGLKASYYKNCTDPGNSLGTLARQQVDLTIDFPNFQPGGDVATPPDDNFAVHWEGKVKSRAAGDYTFTTASDDGVRVWLNGNLIIDNWTYHGTTYDSATVHLDKETKYDIKVEFFQGGGAAVMQLFWSSDTFPNQIIPATQLYTK